MREPTTPGNEQSLLVALVVHVASPPEHAPSTHTSPAAHGRSQAPQWAMSVRVSTHAPEQSVVPPLQPTSTGDEVSVATSEPIDESIGAGTSIGDTASASRTSATPVSTDRASNVETSAGAV